MFKYTNKSTGDQFYQHQKKSKVNQFDDTSHSFPKRNNTDQDPEHSQKQQLLFSAQSLSNGEGLLVDPMRYEPLLEDRNHLPPPN